MDLCGDHPWRWMYPPLQSHASGWLHVGDGHALYWEVSGNPAGAPALFLHGGPGAGCSPTDRRWFDPAHYRIVLFDQRGAGRSRPQGGLEANTTQHLVRDIETLRQHLQVDQWMVFGGSWGATLALAYAQSHSQRVQALVLRGVFLATQTERDWLHAGHGAAVVRPAAWRRFIATYPASSPATLEAFSQQLHCGDRNSEIEAAFAWLQWEQDLMDPEPTATHEADAGPRADQSPADAAAALAMARIGVHFARHAFFLDEGQLIAQADRLLGVPAEIVQGASDLVTPPATAQALHLAWPGSRLRLVPGAGHASSEPGIAQHLIAATDDFRNAQRREIHVPEDQSRSSQARQEAGPGRPDARA